MTPRSSEPAISLTKGWRKATRTGVLHAISGAAMTMTSAWNKASARRSSLQRALAKIDRLETEVVMLTEELELKDARWSRVPAVLPRNPERRDRNPARPVSGPR